jgi:hypothetical protein
MLRDIKVVPDRRDERSGTETWNRRFDRIHAQSVCSNRPYPTSLSVFIAAARVADILTSEGKTMNGSAHKRQNVHRPAWGACRRERQRAGAERVEGVAARRLWPHIGEWDPRQEEPRIVSFARRENGIDSSPATRNGNSRRHVPSRSRRPWMRPRFTRGVASTQTPCACLSALPRPPSPVLNLIVRVGAWREESVPTARAGSDSFASIGA